MSNPAISAQSVSFRYGDATALNDVSFQIDAGCLFGLLGPNGSGKTTLFRLLATLIPVQQGSLTICAHDVANNASAVRRHIGVTFQSPAVDPRLTVMENMRCHGQIYGLPSSLLRTRTEELLRRFEVSDRSDSLVGDLSGGLRRRVELAKGLLHAPDILLLDEPSTGLDPSARQRFWDLIHAQRESEGTTVVVATHLMEEAAACEQLLLLDQGRVIRSGTPTDLQSGLEGQRLTVRLQQGRETRAALERLLDQPGRAVGDRLCFRLVDATSSLQQIMQQMGDAVISAEVAQPTLEDVFLELTGRTLADNEEETAR